MTFKEKLAKDYPIYVIERLKEGCYGCPSSYGYEPTQPKYFCQNTSCGICWNRIIPGTEGEEKVFTKDDLKDGMIVETREGKRYLAFKKNASASYSTDFMFVNVYGYPNYTNTASGTSAVVPCFAIKNKM